MPEQGSSRFHYGGQAVIEGVMMRGKKHFAVACRRASGEITVTAEAIEGGILGTLKWLNKPFLRGTLALVDSLVLGMKSLMWSANMAMEDEQTKASAAAEAGTSAQAVPTDGVIQVAVPEEPKPSGKAVSDIALSVTMFISIIVAIVLFMYTPALLTKLVAGKMTGSRAWLGLIEGGIKLTFFFLYIWGISHMKDIHRVFEYHGAEHKVINAYESGEPLTPENVRKYTTVHVRCGTSFLLVVIFVSIIVFAAVPWTFSGPIWQVALKRLAFKLPLLPVVAGIAYEIIKLAGGRKNSKLLRLVLGPGLLMQRITTQEPSDEQIEVAIKSLQSVHEMEEKSANA